MNEEKIKALQLKIATALGLIDEVRNAAFSELGYDDTRRHTKKIVKQITWLSEALEREWEKDEQELNEDLAK